jgi:hypothetical protein
MAGMAVRAPTIQLPVFNFGCTLFRLTVPCLAPCSVLPPHCLEISAYFGFNALITEGQIIIIENGRSFSRMH